MPAKPPSFLPDDPLEPDLERLFTPLCSAMPPSAANQLQDDVRQYTLRIQEALQQNEFLDIDTAKRLAAVLITLLDEYSTFSPSHRALIIGAVRYFLQDRDAEPDTTSLLGFDDDTIVLNHVLAAIGLSERKVDL